MREAIHALKYDRLHPAARGLGRMLAEAIAQLAAEAPAEMLVVPVPLHRSKYAERGFNQARSLAVYALESLRKIASRVAADAGLEHADAPARHREPGRPDSPPAAPECARRIFGLRSGRGHVKHVLVIDDIFTTGATARAAARRLIEAGAASVWVATLARARHA